MQCITVTVFSKLYSLLLIYILFVIYNLKYSQVKFYLIRLNIKFINNCYKFFLLFMIRDIKHLINILNNMQKIIGTLLLNKK